jgi:hypothetical protein
VIGFPWQWYGELLLVVGVLWLAAAVYRNGRRFGARRMRAVRLWIVVQASPGAAWRRLRLEWRRVRRVSEVRHGTASATLALTVAARGRVTDPNDTPVTIELRRRIEDLEIARDRLGDAIAAHDRRLDDARRSHDELATGGVFVQAWSVVLVVVGSVIATASPWLPQIGWWGVLVFLSPAPLIWLASPG